MHGSAREKRLCVRKKLLLRFLKGKRTDNSSDDDSDADIHPYHGMIPLNFERLSNPMWTLFCLDAYATLPFEERRWRGRGLLRGALPSSPRKARSFRVPLPGIPRGLYPRPVNAWTLCADLRALINARNIPNWADRPWRVLDIVVAFLSPQTLQPLDR